MTEGNLPAKRDASQVSAPVGPIGDTLLAEMGPSGAAFALAQRKAVALSSSELVPQSYRNNVANCMIALELAERTRSSAFMVMQNVHVIQGKPSWSASFIIAAINQCGKFSPIRFKITGEGETLACTATVRDLASEEVLEGPTVTMKMAKEEGWSTKSGSKWKTMPELMIRYRAAAFFGRLYAPEILMGMMTREEMEDIGTVPRSERPSALAASAALDRARDTQQDQGPEKPDPSPDPGTLL